MPVLQSYQPLASDAKGLASPRSPSRASRWTRPTRAIPRRTGTTNPSWTKILANVQGALAEADFLQAYTCASGDAVDDAVQLTGNLTVAKALGTVNAPILGFIRHKGTLGAASSGSSTTAYLVPFLKKTGLSGGTAGGPVDITNAGGYSSTPGTNVVRVGTWISATVAILFASPAAGLDGSALSVLGRAANTAGAGQHRRGE